MTVSIFNTGYEWHVLRTVNIFIDGFSFGLGTFIAFLLCALIVRYTSENKKKPKRDKPRVKLITRGDYDETSK